MDKKVRRKIFERFTREQLIDMLINEKIKSDNYKTSINNLVKKLKELEQGKDKPKENKYKFFFDESVQEGLDSLNIRGE